MTDRGDETSGGRVLLGHGSGGKLYRDLVKDVFVRAFANPILERLDDAATLAPSGRIAFTTDSHVVQPLRFAGGDIGRLSVAGTVNDLATAAARPLALAAAFVIEEGFALDELRAVCASMAATAREADVPIVTGDTKVVERGAADGLFITTTGVGEIVVAHELGAAAVRDGDAVILSGSVGDHAVAILAARGEFHFSAAVESDCAPLWDVVEAALAGAQRVPLPEARSGASGGEEAVRFLRDPTRGGLTTVLAELAEESGLGIEVEEAAIPVSPAVRSVCDLLGYDPLTLANEGKMVIVATPEAADAVVAAVRETEHGREARRIGFVTAAHPGRVALRTEFGTRRVLDMPVGELLPRIC
jgi:hydrogenase expression/formation protein HypE